MLMLLLNGMSLCTRLTKLRSTQYIAKLSQLFDVDTAGITI